MYILFLIISLLSFVTFLVFGILAIVQFVNKNKKKGIRHLLFAGGAIFVNIVAFIAFIIAFPIPEENSEEMVQASTNVMEEQVETDVEKEQEETPEEKAAREAKETEEKAAAEQKAKEEAEAKAKAEEEARKKAEQEAKAKKDKAVANNKEITFPMLNKAADRYTGEPYYLKGEVVQALEDGNYTIMRINMTKNEYGWWEDTVWVEYPDITDAVEGSIVEVYGEIYGSYTYDTAIGGQMTLPAIIAEEVNVLQ